MYYLPDYDKWEVALQDDWEVPAMTGTVDLTKILPTMRAGVSFIGWYDNPEFTGKPLSTVSGDKVLYARWEDDTKTCVPGDHLRLRIVAGPPD